MEKCLTGKEELSETIAELYKDDINVESFRDQRKLIPRLLEGKDNDIKSLTDELKDSKSICRMMPDVVNLLKIYLTMPITTATAERTFSALRRLKSYLRNSMTQRRLNNCMVCHVHKDYLEDISLSRLANEFISRNETRSSRFGRF